MTRMPAEDDDLSTEPAGDTGPDRLRRYRLRARLARWGARLLFMALGSMMLAALSSEPRVMARIEAQMAAWTASAPMPPAGLAAPAQPDAPAAETAARPVVSAMPTSQVPVRRPAD